MHIDHLIDQNIVVMEGSRSYLILMLFTSLSLAAHESKYDAWVLYDPQQAPCMRTIACMARL